MANRRISIIVGLESVLVFILFCQTDLHAQYMLSTGMRTGGTSGLTVRYFMEPGLAMETLLGSFGDGYSFTSLIEKSAPIYYVKGLYVYHGAGVHMAVYNGDQLMVRYHDILGREVRGHKPNDLGFAVNAIFGVEYRMPRRIPISFTADFKPFVEIGTNGQVSIAPDPSIGVKFIIR